jgi:prephenate dehydratase
MKVSELARLSGIAPSAVRWYEAAGVIPAARWMGNGYRAFDELAGSAVDACVLPVENSLGGIVQEVNDYLWEFSGLRVTREHVHPVIHCLVGRRDAPITRAMSHPQALAQCRNWLHARGIEEATELTASVAPWLQADHDNLVGKVLRLPERAEIDTPVQEQLIIELYSK